MIMTSGEELRRVLIAAATSGDILKLLQKVENPDGPLKSIIKRLAKLVAKGEKGTASYGHEVDLKGLVEIYKELKALKDAPVEVASAVKMLKGLLGIKDDAPSSPPAGGPVPPPSSAPAAGNLPSFTRAAVSAAVPNEVGVYKARFIRAGKALDGKYWDADVLKGAVERKMFEGVPLNVITYSGAYGPIDYHVGGETEFLGQLSGNQVGFCQNATWDEEDGSVVGEVWVTDPSRRNLIDAVLSRHDTSDIELPGMSIYASGELDEDNHVRGMEEIHSMDLVTFPAADGAILGPVLAASISRIGAEELRRLGAADGVPVPPSSPVAPQPAPVDSTTPPAAPVEQNQSAEPFGAAWLEERAREVVNDIQQGAAWSDVLTSKFSEFLDALKGFDYDKTRYPVDVMTELPRMAYELVQESKQSNEQPPASQPPANQPVPQSTENGQAGQTPQNVQGGLKMMNEKVILDALRSLDSRMAAFEERVGAVDTAEMVKQKLLMSGLPLVSQAAIQDTLSGSVVSPETVEKFIEHDKKMVTLLEAGTRSRAAVNIDGTPVDGIGGSVEAELDALLHGNR